MRRRRILTLRLPGGMRWRVTLRFDRRSFRLCLALHRILPCGRRTLVAMATWRDHRAGDFRPVHGSRAPAATSLRPVLRAIEEVWG